jgi:hypothetical protein
MTRIDETPLLGLSMTFPLNRGAFYSPARGHQEAQQSETRSGRPHQELDELLSLQMVSF